MGLLLLVIVGILLVVLGVLTYLGRGPLAHVPCNSIELDPKREPPYKVPDAQRRPWVVDYYLIYDSGAYSFSQFYRTKTGACLSSYWKYYFASWGGTTKLRQNGASDD